MANQQKWKVFFLLFVTMFLLGGIQNTKGLILEQVQHDINLNMGQIGTLIMFFQIGFLVASLLTGYFTDKKGLKIMMLIGSLMMAVGLVGTSLAFSVLLFFGFYLIVGLGIGSMLIQFYVSFRNRAALRDVTGDPWGGRTLEWATSSPPPDYNFAFTPQVHELDAWTDMKKHGYERPTSGFTKIHMPKNTWAGFVIAALSAVVGFGLIWQMWLVAGVGFLAMMVAIIVHTFNYKRDYYISADEVIRTENAYTKLLSSHV